MDKIVTGVIVLFNIGKGEVIYMMSSCQQFFVFYFGHSISLCKGQTCYFLGGAPAASAAFFAIFSAIAFASASFFCAGVKVERSPGFGAAGTAFL